MSKEFEEKVLTKLEEIGVVKNELINLNKKVDRLTETVEGENGILNKIEGKDGIIGRLDRLTETVEGENGILNKIEGKDGIIGRLDRLTETVEGKDGIIERLDRLTETMEGENGVIERLDRLTETVEGENGIIYVVGNLNKTVDELNKKVEKIDKSVIIIEDKVSNEIPALFDGYSFNYELQKEDQKRINSLEKQIFNHSIRISNLEIAQKRHSKKI